MRTDDCPSSIPQDNGLMMMPQDEPQGEGPPTVHTDECQTMIKSGFKGKHVTKKFGRYVKRGGNKKLNYTPPQHEPQQILSPSTGRTSTGRKLSTMMIIRKLSTVASNALIQKEVALSENQAMEKQLSKSKVVVEGLHTCLKDAKMGMHSTKLDFINALKDSTTMQKDFLSKEQYHQSNALKQKEVALPENQAMEKQLSKSKIFVEGLRACLKDARTGMRSTKLDFVNALKDNTTM